MSNTPDPGLAQSLTDARLQLHHAAQLATAAGISYLPPKPDDSHTNLEWLSARGMLASNVVPAASPVRVAVHAGDLALHILRAEKTVVALSLHGQTIAGAAAWLRSNLGKLGADEGRFTLARHYEIPHHAVDDGAPFDASDSAALAQLAAWFDVAAGILVGLRAAIVHASPVRCWPHHFDIATLIEVAPGKTIGVGMEPGDVYYDEPYFYVNMYPAPAAPPAATLASRGSWHTHEWVGAVLPVSRLDAFAIEDIRAFIQSAVTACRRAL